MGLTDKGVAVFIIRGQLMLALIDGDGGGLVVEIH
jgi:hypothetical protein